MKLRRKISNWVYDNVPFYAKWAMISHSVRQRRVTLREALELWAQAERDFKPGPTGFLDWEASIPGDFCYLLARQEMDEAEERPCVNGNCVEWWYRGRNIGGFGPAGCGCS